MPDSLVRNKNTTKITGDRGAPLSLAQQAALLPERLRRTPAANLFLALEISGELEEGAFDHAAVALLAEHEILRTVFPDDRRVPYQRVVPVPESAVEVIRLGDAALDAALHADAEHRFDLVREIPTRIRWYVLPDRAVVSIAVHPVAADGRTLELLATELFAAYDDGRAQPAAAQYRSFVAQQLKGLATTVATDPALAYWLDRLAELPERAVPAGESADRQGAARRVFRVPPDTIAALVAGQDTAAAFAALLAGALRDAGMGADIPVGIVDTARSAPGAGTAIGNFANQLVLRLDSAPAGTPRELVEAAARSMAQARTHAQTRIERLTHELKGTGAVATGALFQVLVGVRAGGPVELAGRGYTAREIIRNTARPLGVDLVVDVATEADGAKVTLDFSARLAGHPEIDEFAGHLERLCSAWAAGRDERTGVALFTRPAVTPALMGVSGLGGAPRTEAELVVAEAIRKVLDLDEDDEIGREDTFFSLGGDSIAALRLVTDLGERGYVLDVQTVFGFPAIHELATQLTEAGDTAATGTAAVEAQVAPMSASGLDPVVLAALGKKFGAE
ncbi:condensation domain-containing protein [Nocardia sp. NBC_01730]|uniref:condensation domain-containing protein n=1 Tax=Nocardia sp. NBC_01730 TaxID=2975998 RepID=UPI002E0EE41D|nr:condensation domain-containing protein [Nocardia sp. NBC_01730]